MICYFEVVIQFSFVYQYILLSQDDADYEYDDCDQYIEEIDYGVNWPGVPAGDKEEAEAIEKMMLAAAEVYNVTSVLKVIGQLLISEIYPPKVLLLSFIFKCVTYVANFL